MSANGLLHVGKLHWVFWVHQQGFTLAGVELPDGRVEFYAIVPGYHRLAAPGTPLGRLDRDRVDEAVANLGRLLRDGKGSLPREDVGSLVDALNAMLRRAVSEAAP